MGRTHGGSSASAPATRRVRLVLLAAVAVVVGLTAAGLVALWPAAEDRVTRLPTAGEGSSYVEAEVLRVLPEARLLEVDVDGLTLAHVPPEVLDGGVEAGDRVLLVRIDSGDGVPLVWVDHARDRPMLLLAVVFGVLVVAVARWRGLASLIGLGASLALIAVFTLPALVAGRDPLLVGLVTAGAALVLTLYLAHGVSVRTTTALLGTVLGVGLTGALAVWSTRAAQLSGRTTEDAVALPTLAPDLDLRGVVLCGIVLAGLGVLNDVTITQASAVWELREVAPDLGRWELFRRAMRIGRDHIASTVYTIAFAYVGAALPIMLLLSLYDQSLARALTGGEVAEEVVRTLVGSIGLVAAIPLTTAVAALAVPAAAPASPPGEVRPAPAPAESPAPTV